MVGGFVVSGGGMRGGRLRAVYWLGVWVLVESEEVKSVIVSIKCREKISPVRV